MKVEKAFYPRFIPVQDPLVNDPEKKKIDSTISSRSLSFLTIDRYTCHEEKIVIGRLNQPETAQGQRWICRIDSVEHR